MSNERILEARLTDHRGPYFDGLEATQSLFGGDLQRINEVLLGDVQKATKTGLPKVRRLITTDDGYIWMFGIRFTHYDREIMVLIPSMLDSKKQDGTHTDRHVALYYKGAELSDGELKRIVRKATAAFEDTYDEHYGHIV